MGYYTDFNLSTIPAEDQVYIDGWEFPWGPGAPEESEKWYSCEDDMKELSLVFPNTIFVVEGDGEEHFDVWKKAFYKGEIIWEWKLSMPDVPEELVRKHIGDINE